jgi:hypothetical protein
MDFSKFRQRRMYHFFAEPILSSQAAAGTITTPAQDSLHEFPFPSQEHRALAPAATQAESQSLAVPKSSSWESVVA